MPTPALQVNQLSVRLSGEPVLYDISFTVNKGECLAITGHTGSGKTTLLKALAAQILYSGTIQYDSSDRKPRIALIPRQHHFTNLSNISSFYYQQRFNSFDSEDARKLEDELATTGATGIELEQTLSQFGLLHVRQSPLLQLSNGEHKRFQLARALLLRPDWILLDNPYTGLDKSARKLLDHILADLVNNGLQVILTSSITEIPPMVSQTILLKQGKVENMFSKAELPKALPTAHHFDPSPLKHIPAAYDYPAFTSAVKMVNTTVTYGGRKILDSINWDVKNGACWNLAGHNGSGKSTLLSLINGDNPQAFANEIYLFDRRKGTGESIWDIKQKTGFISPELHHYFEGNTSCFHLVASGLFDTMGLFRQLNARQQELTQAWMDCMQVSRFANRRYNTLSDGEQRRVLLTRALVKNPPLLLLDEPCQGLDADATSQFLDLVNHICTELHKTLIFVSHYEAEIPTCVTARLILDQGRVAL